MQRKLKVTLCILAIATEQAMACMQVPTELTMQGTKLMDKPITVDGNNVELANGDGSVRFAYNRISRKWCFQRMNAQGSEDDSGCVTETTAAGGAPMLQVKGQLKRSLPLRDDQGNTYAELTFRADRMTATLLDSQGNLGAQRVSFTDQTDGGRESVRVTSRLCDAGSQCEGASFTSAKNRYMRGPDSRTQSRSYGPLNLANTRSDFQGRECEAPYAVMRRGRDFRLAGSNTNGTN